MKTKLFKSKLFTIAMAAMIAVAMLPSMAVAQDFATQIEPNSSNLTRTAPGDPEIVNGWSQVTLNGISMAVSKDTEKLYFERIQGNHYEIKSTQGNYYPQNFSMKVSMNATVTGTNGASFGYYNPPYGVVAMGSTDAVLTLTSGGSTIVVDCHAPNGGGTAGTSLQAYLPGYGQFANEGINSGGWGDGYLSGTSDRKNLVGNISSVGMSLGSFGGYAVLEFPAPVENSPNNKYGIDFILYGNAFVGNSEPGGVQVSQDGSTWYNIAGSRHYMSDTVWDCTATYTNPNPGDNSLPSLNPTNPAYPNNVTGTAYTSPHPYALSYTTKPWQTEPTASPVNVVYNPWHNHSWFPLEANYFNSRKTGETSLANKDAYPFVTYDGASGQMTLSGVMTKHYRGEGNENIINEHKFGYCDVHPNGGTPGVATNPYTATASTQGGDGIDISWAVDGEGNPVWLDSIKFVRVYTGVATMNPQPIFGEVSTEITGMYEVNHENSPVGVAYQTAIEDESGNVYEPILVGNGETQGITSIVQEDYRHIYKIYADPNDVYLNGVRFENSDTYIPGGMIVRFDGESFTVEVEADISETKYLQIITYSQGGEEAFVNLVKFNR